MRRAIFACIPKLGERGNVALMTAIIAPLLLLIGGFAVDYGYASYLNQRLAQATDDAVLGSVSQSAATAGGGFSNTDWLQTYGINVFNANVANLPISNVKFSLQVTPNGTGGVNSVGVYTYDYPTFFAGVIGMSKISLTNQIKASANPITYIDYYIIVDVSESMGIGSTKADMDALWNRGLTQGAGAFTEQSCVFACHMLHPTQTGSKTNEQIAHAGGPPITLRIDAAVSAIQNIISAAQSKSGIDKNIRIGLYTMNHDPANVSKYYTVISKPTSDYATLITQAATIDLANNTPSYGDTEFLNTFTTFSAAELPLINGSGASAIAPKNYVFIISDGLADNGYLDSCVFYGNVCSKPIAPGDCAALKLKSTVGTIYTVYNPIYQNNDKTQGLEKIVFKPLVAPFLDFDVNGNVVGDQMADGLKGCSSDPSKYYFSATDGPAINSAMQSLFASTLQNARLTQ